MTRCLKLFTAPNDARPRLCGRGISIEKNPTRLDYCCCTSFLCCCYNIIVSGLLYNYCHQAMAFVARNICRTASRNLTRRAPVSTSLRALASAAPSSRLSQRIAPAFSTMASLRSGAQADPKGPKEFDPEITEMANYIHNYSIKSDLAVSYVHHFEAEDILTTHCVVRHCSLRLH